MKSCRVLALFTASFLAISQVYSQPPPFPVREDPPANSIVTANGSGPASHDALPPLPPGEAMVKNAAFARFSNITRPEVETFISDHMAQELLSVRAMSTRNHDQAVEMMTDLIQDALKFQKLAARYPHQFEKLMEQRNLEHKANRLSEDIPHLDGLKKKKAEAELSRTLKSAFLAKQDLMKTDLKHLEAELKKLKMLIDKRQANMEAIVERRLEEMTQDAAFMEW